MGLKVCHVINNFDNGGAEKLLIETIPFYIEAGVDLTILQLSNRNSHPKLLEKLNNYLINNIVLSSTSIYNPSIILKLRKVFAANNFDVVHVHLFPAMYWVALACDKEASIFFTEHSNVNKRLNNKVFKWIDRFIYNKYTKIIAISESIANKISTWIDDNEKVITIRNGIHLEKFRNANVYSSLELWEKFNISKNTQKILMVARFSYPKDHATVIKAFAGLGENFSLLFAGVGPDIGKAINLVNELGLKERVFFLSYRDDIPSLVKSVEVNILSSKYEGMSGVTLETLAGGRPFLGSDVVGIKDVVPDSRFLFAPGNVNELTKKIAEISNNTDLELSMIEDGQKFVEQFDIKLMVETYVGIYGVQS